MFKLNVAIAQTNVLKGRVLTSDTLPVKGASIMLSGKPGGTKTDQHGRFTISGIASGDRLIVSSVGYEDAAITITNQDSVLLFLKIKPNDLDEVVVVGYGTVRKKDLTGAVATISGKAITDRKQIRISQALQGAVSGVTVTRDGGAANTSATIRIRGITTIGNSDPLVIIDGIPGTLDWVNPNDVESISVLKDAASASIYGSRAAAGVIVVTTKRANNEGGRLEYTAEFGIERPTEIAKYADAKTYMRLINERGWNDNSSGSQHPVFSEETIENYDKLHLENPDLYPNENWQPLLMKTTAPRQSHRINLSAASNKFSSNVSVMYDETSAFYMRRSYDRLTVRANNDFKIFKGLTAQFDLNGIYSVQKQPTRGISPSTGVAPIYAALWQDGRIAAGKSGVNPYAALLKGGDAQNIANQVKGRLAVNYAPIKALAITAVISPELFMDKSKTFTEQIKYTLANDPNATAGYIEGHTQTKLAEGRNYNHSVTSQFFANYVESFGRHNLNVMIGNENYNYYNEALGASREQYQLSGYPYLNIGNQNYQYNSGSAFENAYRSFFGRAMYNFDQKYFLQVNARYDGSSRFDKDYRWGLFPSMSAGWVLSRESFLTNVSFLNFLKLRASYGSLGNERIGNYPYQSTIGFNNALFFKGTEVVSTQTAAVTRYAIKDITWETTTSYDIGIDARFFKNKLSFTADYYKKVTKDMLLALEIPDYIGLDNPDQNTGKMFTKGWEAELGWAENYKDFSYSVAFNISDSRTRMGDLGGTEFLGAQVKYEGSEFNEWYGYKSLGIYQTQEQVDGSVKLNAQTGPGDIQYADISGPDGVPDGKISAEYDRILLGGSLPRYQYGGNIGIRYKNFDFSLSFQGIGKRLARLTTDMVQPFRAQYIEVPEVILGKYWSKYNTAEENARAVYPRISNNANTGNYTFSDFWLFNGSYLRMKNIGLGYQVPDNFISKLKMASLKLYFSISDLPAFSHYPRGWDPEGSSYWIPTTYLIGIAARF
jgi:TonB-linked SusC/RagA family outer membrane protein